MTTALITCSHTAIGIPSGIFISNQHIISGPTTYTTSVINYYSTFTPSTCTTSPIISTVTGDIIYYTDTIISICGHTTNQTVYLNFQEAKKLAKPNHKPIRSAIKKGLKLISGLGFNDEILCFMGGSGIEVSHPDSDFKFVLTKNRSVIDATRSPGYSTPYKLELFTKTNLFVSKLCVYMEGTPVLDQVLGLMMFVKSGDEELILRKANYPGLTNDMKLRDELSIKHPELVEKLKPSFFQNSSETLNGFVL